MPTTPHPIAQAIAITWRRNSAYALRLVGELQPEQFFAQPVPGRTLNHPAFLLAHLGLYAGLAGAMLRREPIVDPADHPFGPKARVQGPEAYPSPIDLLGAFRAAHDATERALAAADPGVFATPTPLERWRTLHPTTGDMLVTLMVKHESGHLGQLSAWRRAMGLAPVPM